MRGCMCGFVVGGVDLARCSSFAARRVSRAIAATGIYLCPPIRPLIRLRPPAGQPRVGEESAERLPYPAEEPVNRGHERREPETAQGPAQPPGGGDVFEQADPCRAVHHPHPGRLDELPRLVDLVLGDTRGIRRGRLIVPA
jgi:hypothetical protein